MVDQATFVSMFAGYMDACTTEHTRNHLSIVPRFRYGSAASFNFIREESTYAQFHADYAADAIQITRLSREEFIEQMPEAVKVAVTPESLDEALKLIEVKADGNAVYFRSHLGGLYLIGGGYIVLVADETQPLPREEQR